MIEPIIDLRPRARAQYFLQLKAHRENPLFPDRGVDLATVLSDSWIAFLKFNKVARVFHSVYRTRRQWLSPSDSGGHDQRIIALAVELRVFGIGKRGGMQSVCSIEWHPHPEKHRFVYFHTFGKKIVALVQTHAMQQRHRVYPLVDVTGQALRRYRAIRQASDLLIEIAMIEFFVNERKQAMDCIVTN